MYTVVAHICAWCSTLIELSGSTEYNEQEYVETHTICPTCYAKQMAEYED
jgi:hypothetical protein